MFEIILIFFTDNLKCKIKKQIINKRVIATEPNHLNGRFIQGRNTVMLLRDAKMFCGSCLELFLVGKRAKTGNVVSTKQVS